MKPVLAKLAVIAVALIGVGGCVQKAHSPSLALGRCETSGISYLGENVCRLSFNALVSHAETLEGKLVSVSGVLSSRYELPVLIRFPPSSKLNDVLDTFALSGPWSDMGSEITVREALVLPMDIEERFKNAGHAAVSLMGRFHLGAEPALANQNLGTIEVVHIVQRTRGTNAHE